MTQASHTKSIVTSRSHNEQIPVGERENAHIVSTERSETMTKDSVNLPPIDNSTSRNFIDTANIELQVTAVKSKRKPLHSVSPPSAESNEKYQRQKLDNNKCMVNSNIMNTTMYGQSDENGNTNDVEHMIQQIEENKVQNNEDQDKIISEQGEEEVNDNDEDQEPDWDAITQHEPAITFAPMFLAARDRREVAKEKFAKAIDDFHDSLKNGIDAMLDTTVEIYDLQCERLDGMEEEIKRDFTENEHARSQMQSKLEDSARAAQGLFADLLMRVSQPLSLSSNRHTTTSS
eukprot:CAMPEP_0194362710 /NCGR_PEP_ID=MMETSP0174-20130528/10506_1 /TAXON_ID=216777 /ORGANISM="Proboscia alata, Strain PI-D3" /LENGTH=288 /DNA_ID=CAMNT_0039135751 /DNA_START=117 /DNA_END=983 /DNA_ORIENTATION=+